jgi:hypothetical protein
MSRRILIPLDRSELAERVLTHIRWLAPPDRAETEVLLLSVTEPWRYYFGVADYTPRSWSSLFARLLKNILKARPQS